MQFEYEKSVPCLSLVSASTFLLPSLVENTYCHYSK